MSGAHSEDEDSEGCEVEDVKTGQRYRMYRLNIAAWPTPPRVVYECPACQERFDPVDWSGGCPACSGKGKHKRRKSC